jgi:hypothetical protein
MNLKTQFIKKIIYSLFIFMGLFFLSGEAKADVITDTMMGGMPGSRARNVTMTISHNQEFEQGDSINFSFSGEFKSPNITCGKVEAAARLTFWETNPYYPGEWIVSERTNNRTLIGTSHSGRSVTCTETGESGWVRVTGTGLTATIPSDLEVDYTVAAIYLVYYRSDGTGGWNTGSFGEKISIVRQTCECSTDSHRAPKNAPNVSTAPCIGAKGVCNTNCKKVTTNNCLYDILVPTKTVSEWNSFIGNHPSCVSVTPCI